MLAAEPPSVDKSSETPASTSAGLENVRKCFLRSFLTSTTAQKRERRGRRRPHARQWPLRRFLAVTEVHGAERAVEKPFRSPRLEDASVDEASHRAFNARVHASFYIKMTVF